MIRPEEVKKKERKKERKKAKSEYPMKTNMDGEVSVKIGMKIRWNKLRFLLKITGILRHSEILMGPGASRLESKVRVHSRAGAGSQNEVWGAHTGSCYKAPLPRITAHTRTLTPPHKYVPLTNYTPLDPQHFVLFQLNASPHHLQPWS